MKPNIYICCRGSPVDSRGRGRRNTSALTVCSVSRRRRSCHPTPLGCGSRGSARICVSCSRRHAQGTRSSSSASRTSTCDRHCLGVSRRISACLGISRRISAHLSVSQRISAYLGASQRISAHLGVSRRISRLEEPPPTPRTERPARARAPTLLDLFRSCHVNGYQCEIPYPHSCARLSGVKDPVPDVS